MTRRYLTVALLMSVVVCTGAFAFGGWAVVTVEDVPEYLVAGESVPLSFVVRQHGVTRLNGLSPSVTLRSGSTSETIDARANGATGRYVASLKAPRAGEWTITVNSGFGPSKTTMLPLKAVASGTPAPAALATADRGQHLFVAKGCTTCHVRGAFGTDGFKDGPDLTSRRYVAAELGKFLSDPERSPLARPNTGQLRMPNLGLRDQEITALVSYLNADVRVSTRNP